MNRAKGRGLWPRIVRFKQILYSTDFADYTDYSNHLKCDAKSVGFNSRMIGGRHTGLTFEGDNISENWYGVHNFLVMLIRSMLK